jgi:hypothetical protein
VEKHVFDKRGVGTQVQQAGDHVVRIVPHQVVQDVLLRGVASAAVDKMKGKQDSVNQCN